jgi:hypothetical protein
MMPAARFTESDLEGMRKAAIGYYRQGPHEFAGAFVPELERGAIMFDGGVPRVGLWIVEDQGDKVTLVRQPPLSPVMMYFGVVFGRSGDEWVVEREIERTDYMDDLE